MLVIDRPVDLQGTPVGTENSDIQSWRWIMMALTDNACDFYDGPVACNATTVWLTWG